MKLNVKNIILAPLQAARKSPVVVAFLALVLVMHVYFYTANGIKPVEQAMLSDTALLVGLSFLISAFGRLAGTVTALATGSLITIVILTNTVYYRFFHRFPPPGAVKLLPMLKQAGDALARGVRPYEWIIPALPLAILVAYFVFPRNSLQGSPHSRFKKISISALLLVVWSTLVLSTSHAIYKKQWFAGDDLWIARKTGPEGFHLYQLYQHIRTRPRPVLPEEKEFIQTELERKASLPAHPRFAALKGICRKCNIIIVLVESLHSNVIQAKVNSQEVTPFLNLMAEESFYFPWIFSVLGPGNTSDAEFSLNTGLYPLANEAVYISYHRRKFNALPRFLKTIGYFTAVFHAFDPAFWNRMRIYPQLGFQKFFSVKDLKTAPEDVIGWGLGDRPFLEQVVQHLKTLPQPFYTMLITLSSHVPYRIPRPLQGINIPPEIQDPTASYLQAIHYTDRALARFVSLLKVNGLYHKTLLVIVGDHGPLLVSPEALKKLKNKGTAPDSFSFFHVPLFIHVPTASNPERITRVGSLKDIPSTLLFLLGEEKKFLSLGENLFSQSEGFVPFRRYVKSGSWLSNKKYFTGGKCHSFPGGESLAPGECEEGIKRAHQELNISDAIILKDITFYPEPNPK